MLSGSNYYIMTCDFIASHTNGQMSNDIPHSVTKQKKLSTIKKSVIIDYIHMISCVLVH